MSTPVLDKIEQFSPETVMFDIMFIKPDQSPCFLSEKADLNPETKRDVEEAFLRMDNEFTKALKKYDNVYIDLQLVENAPGPRNSPGKLTGIESCSTSRSSITIPSQ